MSKMHSRGKTPGSGSSLIRTTDAKSKEDRRRLAVQRVLENETQSDVALSLRVSVRAVSNWMRWYRQQGEDGLKLIPHPGPAPKMSEEQTLRVHRWLKEKSPKQFGIDADHWNSRTVQKLIRKELQIEFNANYLCRWLKKFKFTSQMPAVVDIRRDEKAIQEYPEKDFQSIVKKGLPNKRLSS